MKQAKAADHWRNTYNKRYAARLEQLSFQNVNSIGSGEILFRGGVTAICGSNGVGKTTLLEAILSSLGKKKITHTTVHRIRMGNYRLTAHLNLDNSAVEVNTAADDEDVQDFEGINIYWLDPAVQSAALISRFATMTHVDELLEALLPREASEEELKLLSYIVGRNYDSCEIYEIDELDDEQSFPYFKVRCQGIEYGSETMGLGEMALHLMFWHLNQMPENSILLLEEPETHVSPRSQTALLDVVAKFSVQKSIWVILSTHSPGIVAKIPREHIRLLSRQGGAVQVIDTPLPMQLQTVLGVIPNYSGVLLVEDYAAKEFLKAWLRHHDPSLLQTLDIVIAGSDGAIDAALKSFPRAGSWLKVMGVYDGDMRTRKQEEERQEQERIQRAQAQANRRSNVIDTYKSSYLFLPGTSSPEEVLKEIAPSSIEQIAELNQRTSQDIHFILGELEGLDHHDWFIEFQRRLGISYEKLMSDLFHIWVQIDVNANTSRNAFDELIRMLQANE